MISKTSRSKSSPYPSPASCGCAHCRIHIRCPCRLIASHRALIEMPFEGEYATGESLLSLQQSEAFREFKGRVRPRPPGPAVAPTVLNVPRNAWMPRRVIAVDG